MPKSIIKEMENISVNDPDFEPLPENNDAIIKSLETENNLLKRKVENLSKQNEELRKSLEVQKNITKLANNAITMVHESIMNYNDTLTTIAELEKGN